jgi:outer membrane protein insertion porin family
VFGGFIFSLSAEGGAIKSLEKNPGAGDDAVRITDRFYLGEPQFRGFDIRGVGPRVQRFSYTTDASGNQTLITAKDQILDDALGGKAYYLGKAELEIPLGAGAAELGLRPSIFAQFGALFGMTDPGKTITFTQATSSTGQLLFNSDGSPTLLPKDNFIKDASGNQYYVVSASDASNAGSLTLCQVGYSTATTPGTGCAGTSINAPYNIPTQPFIERYAGDSAKPRIAIGAGVNWNSPFGPLRIDISKALVTVKGDTPKLFTFNVGTQF